MTSINQSENSTQSGESSDIGRAPETREISQNYRITTKQGDGGCSVIYDAWRLSDGVHVALKVLALSPAVPPEDAEILRARFFHEARILASLTDEHAVKCTEFGLFNSAPAIVLEFISGKQLDEYIAEYGCLPVEYAHSIIRQVLLALEDAHSKGVIHRDLKPANIMIIKEVDPPEVKLIDFGIATILEGPDRKRLQSQNGTIRGTPSYMAPELFSGENTATIECDVYAIGLILLECLTGKQYYSNGSVMQLAYRHNTEALKIPQNVPKCLADIILKCCQKAPEDRYHSARAIIDALDDVLPQALEQALAISEPQPESDTPSIQEPPAARGKRTTPIVVILILLISVAAIAGLFFATKSPSAPDLPPENAPAPAPQEPALAPEPAQQTPPDNTNNHAEQPSAPTAVPVPPSSESDTSAPNAQEQAERDSARAPDEAIPALPAPETAQPTPTPDETAPDSKSEENTPEKPRAKDAKPSKNKKPAGAQKTNTAPAAPEKSGSSSKSSSKTNNQNKNQDSTAIPYGLF